MEGGWEVHRQLLHIDFPHLNVYYEPILDEFLNLYMIKAVIFDFGNVIYSLDNSVFLKRLTKFTELSFAELEELIYRRSGIPRRYETGLMTTEQFYKEMTDLCHLFIPPEEFAKAFTEIFEPIPSTIDLINRLEPHYKLGLLSNTNELDFTHVMRKTDVFDLFDSVTLSYRVKAMKPDEAIYRNALDQLSLGAPACVYIDDIRENVEAADRLGMRGVHYTGHDAMMRILHTMGIEA